MRVKKKIGPAKLEHFLANLGKKCFSHIHARENKSGRQIWETFWQILAYFAGFCQNHSGNLINPSTVLFFPQDFNLSIIDVLDLFDMCKVPKIAKMCQMYNLLL